MTLLSSMQGWGIAGTIIGSILIVVLLVVIVATRYKKCPSDKVMVIYGSVGKTKDGAARSSRCIHGGAAFVWPFVQGYSYLDLTPISLSVDLQAALSRQNIRIDVPSRFTVGISTETGVMQNAAERLLGLKLSDIQDLAKDIILGQMRLIIATMEIEDINSNRDKFLEAVSVNIEGELKKIGLRLINVNVTDINDESGYIKALAAKAENDAKQEKAERDRDGEIATANAMRDQRIAISAADSTAVDGENTAKIKISQSNSKLREARAAADRDAQIAEFVAQAKANEEAYKAEQIAELERAKREKATKEADVIVNAEIRKREIEIAAEAEAERIRRHAQGEADALYAKRLAEAKGIMEVMSKQAEGFDKMVKAAGGDADKAVRLMISDKLEDLVKLQAEAIKNIKIDKVTVWDSMSGENGSSATSNFISSLYKSVPPLNDMFKQAGMDLPEYLGKETAVATVENDKPKDNKKK